MSKKRENTAAEISTNIRYSDHMIWRKEGKHTFHWHTIKAKTRRLSSGNQKADVERVRPWGRGYMQSATLLEPWPTSRIWLMWVEQTATPAPARQWDTEPTSSHLSENKHWSTAWNHSRRLHHLYISPVHPRLEGLHRVQVDVSIVPSYREDTPHHRGDADSAPRCGQLRHILPAVHPGVEALDGAQRRIIVETTFGQTGRSSELCSALNWQGQMRFWSLPTT